MKFKDYLTEENKWATLAKDKSLEKLVKKAFLKHPYIEQNKHLIKPETITVTTTYISGAKKHTGTSADRRKSSGRKRKTAFNGVAVSVWDTFFKKYMEIEQFKSKKALVDRANSLLKENQISDSYIYRRT